MKRVDAILQFGSGVGDRYIKYRNEQLFAVVVHHARVAFAEMTPEHDVVFYWHGSKTEKQNIRIPDSMPQRANSVGSFEDSIRFIASGKTVISNSYHGVYWSLLLGRKTICIPLSNKFYGYRLPPAYATRKNWLHKLETGIAQPQMLDTCRAATMDFKAKVDALLTGAG